MQRLLSNILRKMQLKKAYQPTQDFIDMRYGFSKSSVPPNSVLFGGTVPPNSVLFGGTVPPNSVLFGGTVPPNSFPHFLKPILALKPWVQAGRFVYHEPYNPNDFSFHL